MTVLATGWLIQVGDVPASSVEIPSDVLCALVDGLPHRSDPVRQNRVVAAPLRDLERMGEDPRVAARVHRRLHGAVDDALTQASRVFGGGKWTKARAKKARRFLKKTSQGPRALLRVGSIGFEPRPVLRAALQRSACVSGKKEDAIVYGRGATGVEGSDARAFAALVLLEVGRTDEARELLPTLEGDGFLVHFLRAELRTETPERRQAHSLAAQRAISSAHERALAVQGARLPPSPEDAP